MKKKTLSGHVAHHAKRVYHGTPKFVHGMVIGTFVGIILVASLRAATTNALSIPSSRDCDTNAVINCGALTTSELQTRYHNKGVADIYSYFGISSSDIANVTSTAVAGEVHKNGTVTVDGKIVATSAVTAGRLNISGSTKVKSGSTTFYKRAPSVSFRVSSLSAFVIMEKGQFKAAILGACGNPVMAKPIVTHKPAPPTPPVTPPVGSTQTPPSVPTVTTASTPPTELPNTGPGAIIIIAVLAIIGGYVTHLTHRHIRRKRRANPTAHHARSHRKAHA
jgi:hypothetical protein